MESTVQGPKGALCVASWCLKKRPGHTLQSHVPHVHYQPGSGGQRVPGPLLANPVWMTAH